MLENPYRFTGPVDPVAHRFVCCQRNPEIAKVISGIKKGDYWSVIGPSQIGKSTLLKQLMHILSGYYYIYIDMEATPKDDREFYKMLVKTVSRKIPCEPFKENIEHFASEAHFYDFLKLFKPQEDKPVIFFFDEIEKAYSVNSFLHIWRRVFHERDFEKNLKNYTVIAAGKAELSSLTAGEDANTSPFNIAQTLNLSELSREDAEQLIIAPCKSLGIDVELAAKEKILTETNGHPQLLQHLCYIALEGIQEEKATITGTDVEKALERLYLENKNLKTMLKEIKTGRIPEDLIRRLLEGEKIGYLAYQDLSVTGTGPIINEGRDCAIRNNIYAEFLKQVIKIESPAAPSPTQPKHTAQPLTPEQPGKEAEFKTTIYFDEEPPGFTSEEKEKEFLTKLFKCQNKKIEIIKDDKIEILKGLSFKEELTFCYLAYKNYKAINQEEYSNWQSIPHTYKYYLSSSTDNNEKQKPEWEAFKFALKRIEGSEFIGDNIKTWIFALRKNLKKISAADVVFSESGRGSGYLLKGTVNFTVSNR